MELIRRLLLWLRRPVVGVVCTLLACAGLLGLLPLPVSDHLDRLVYDARLRSQAAPFEGGVVIVDIDERSLAEHGRWPWSRQDIATLVERIVDQGGASVLGLDTLFAEAERNSNGDARLAAALQGRPVVLGYYFSSDRGGIKTGQLPAAVMDASAFAQTGHRITSWTGYGANLAPLQRAAGTAGFFNPLLDDDGVVRALPLLAEYQGRIYESLVVAILRRHLGGASLALTDEELVLRGPRGRAVLPLSSAASALVPFAGRLAAPAEPLATVGLPPPTSASHGSQRFRYVSAAAVLAGRVAPAVFRNRIVLLGTSAPGLTDLRATPVHAAFPGVEIHAALLAAALDPAATANIKRRSEVSLGVSLVVVAVAGLLLALLLPMAGAVGVVALGLVVAAAQWLVASIAWAHYGLAIPLATGLLLTILLTGFNLAAGYFVERRARRAVASLFGEYVSPALVERMMRDPKRYARTTSENRELTMLFVDIRGFTRIAETMQPEHLREYINDFLTTMTEVIHRYGGTVDKYIGDAVMAFWGAPLEDEQHADHAVAAALAMLEEVQRLNQRYELRSLPLMRVGIGINTGVVRVGDLGSRLRRAYTVIGDAVNLASRLEGLTKRFDAPIIVGESTRLQARGHRFAELGSARVPGRAEPVRAFAPNSVIANPALARVLDASNRARPAEWVQDDHTIISDDALRGAQTVTSNPGDRGGRGGRTIEDRADEAARTGL